jgi:hypothetical protein
MCQEEEMTTEVLEAVASKLGLLNGTPGLYAIGVCKAGTVYVIRRVARASC